VLVHQDAHVFVSHLSAGARVEHELAEERGAYLYVIEGDVSVNGEKMATGDAAQITDERRVAIEAQTDSELILVDVSLA
jgi:redox-sensitive bicupin YhaK (pirin superfamily)